MTRKTLLLFLFIVLLTLGWSETALAQKDIPFSFDTFRHVKNDVCFNKVTVIDNRVEKSSLGYVRKPGFAADRPRYLVMKDDFVKGLEEYILRLVKDQKQQDRELLLVVYDMYAEDEPVVGNNIVTFYLRTDVFISNSGKYQLLNAIDTLYEVSTDQDASLLVQRTIGNTIKDLVSSLSPMDDNVDGEQSFTLEQASGRIANEKKKWPIYNEKQKSGLYTSYEQLLKNEPLPIPIIVEIITINEAQKKTIFARKNEKGRKGDNLDPSDYYAVYTGEKWYFSEGNKLVKMRFENGDFYTEDIRMGIYKRTIYKGSNISGVVPVIDDAIIGGKKEGVYKVRIDVMRNGMLVPVKRIIRL